MKILTGSAGILALVLPIITFGATYHYVDVNGDVQQVEANSAAEALTKPTDIAANSGVAIDRDIIQPGMSINDNTVNNTSVPTMSTTGMTTYQYVDVNGNIKSVEAYTAAEALTKPNDIALHSGVMVAE